MRRGIAVSLEREEGVPNSRQANCRRDSSDEMQFKCGYSGPVSVNRWGSPNFLLGESYGGIRAAGLSGELQKRYRMYLNGIVLISPVIDFQTLSTVGNTENDDYWGDGGNGKGKNMLGRILVDVRAKLHEEQDS